MFSEFDKKKILASLFLAAMIITSGPISAQMLTSAQFQVSESGAASYTVPIQVSPGVGGMEPRISLNYSSQSGNGLLGMGWSIGGLGGIARCPRTVAQDGVRGGVNYDNNDRYCLDGQRLIAISGSNGGDGSEYRTERESFAKIVSYGSAGNGPAWFKVWTKAGQVMLYGATPDSRIEARGKNSVRLWALNRIEDTKGNYLTVSYIEDPTGGDFYPNQIDYTGNSKSNISPAISLRFQYDNRPDSPPAYQAGALMQRVSRLNRLELVANHAITKTYQLSYASGALNRSILSGIQECAGADCLPAISLQYTSSGGAVSVPAFFPAASQALTTISLGDHLYTNNVVDVDGDGKADLIAMNQGTSGWNAWVSKGRGDGTFAAATLQTLTTVSLGINLYQSSIADLNGDGKPDLIALSQGVTGWYAWVALGRGDGTFAPATVQTLTTTSLGDQLYSSSVADLRGNGKGDLIAMHQGPTGWYAWVAKNRGDGTFEPATVQTLTIASLGDRIYASSVTDLNGDGIADIVAMTQGATGWYIWKAIGRGDGTFEPATVQTLTAISLGTGLYSSFMADLNGDGNADAIAVHQGPTGWYAWVALGKGDGTFEPATSQTLTTVSLGNNLYKPLLADVNGDGRADLVASYQGSDGWYVWTSLGKGDGKFSAATVQALTTISLGVDLYDAFVADLNGDGVTDLVATHQGAGWYAWTSQGTMKAPDLLSTVSSNGRQMFGIQYAPLSDARIYTKDSNVNSATYPIQDVIGPLYVVSSLSSENGTGETTSATYTYGGLKSDLSGRGLLGFRWLQSRQVETALTSYTEYLQQWPYTGLPTVVKKSLAGGGNNGVLSEIVSNYDCNDAASSTVTTCGVSPGKRYFVYAKQSRESGWDYNGVALPVITTSTEYDNWGNALKVDVSTNDGFGKITINSYSNDGGNWLLGRLLRSSVTSTAP